MKEYVLRAEQFVPRPLDEVFAFFARAENLQEITPAWLHFRIVSVDPSPIRTGTIIQYRLRWRIFPMRWRSKICAWDPPHQFVDVQLSGPYGLWHHEHRFVAEGRGTRIFDEVRYTLPLGILGRIAHRLTVRRDVERIFEYRRQAVERILAK